MKRTLLFFTLLCTALLASQEPLSGQCSNNNNRCLDFDPVSPSDYVQTTSSPVTGNSNFTVEARFLCTSTGTNSRRLFAFGGGTNNRFEISESGGSLRFIRQVVGGSTSTSIITSANVRDGNWHHLAATRTGATVRVYLDGTQVYSTTGFTGDLNTTTFRIGASVLSTGATFHWDGRIDEVRVWDVERTAAEINEYRLCWVPCSSSGLKVYYHFNQGTGGGDNTGLTVLEDCNAQINGILIDFTLMGTSSNWICSNDSSFTNGLCCGASFTVSQQTCGSVDFINTTTGSFTYSWTFGDGGSSTQTSPTHTYTSSGTYTVTLTATPVPSGAPCSVQQTITVTADNRPPTVSCKNKIVDFNAGQSSYTLKVSDILQSATDSCCAANLLTYIILSDTNFTCANACPPTSRTVTLMASDCHNNTSTCTAQVETRDLTRPTSRCKDINVGIGTPGTFTITAADVDNGSTDNCSPLTLAVSPSTFGCPAQGCEQVHTVALIATDCAGNTATCTAQVTVRDVIGPVFTNCPIGTLSLLLQPGECIIPNPFAAQATDNCDMMLDMSFQMTGANNISGTGTGQGVLLFGGPTTIAYTATDACSNTATCVFKVLVQDQEPPTILCPTNLTVQGSSANGGATVNLPSPVATDNCFFTTVTSSHASGSLFPCGNTVVLYTATDQNGNQSTCTMTVTVDCSAGPTCECGTFSGLTLGPKGGKVLQLACGQNYTVPCPVAGTSFEVKGNFACNPTTCAPSNMTWTLKNSDGLTVASGTMAGSPFTLAVAGSAMSTPDTYTLTLGADCGQTSCVRCVIGLVVTDCCTNRALDFDGVDDQVSLAPSPVSGNSDFTAEVMFTCTASSGGTSCSGGFRRLIALSGPITRFEVGECGGILNIYWYDGSASSGPTQMEPTLNVRDGVCRHLAVVRSGDNVEVFLNGTSIYTGSGVNPLNTNLFRLGQWGGSLAPGENWQGTMDEVRLWNYPRTAAQINEFRNCPLTGSETGLMVYWPMDQGLAQGNNPTVTQALDATTGLDNGTLNNFALSGAHSNWVCGCADFGEGCSRVDTLCGRAVITCFSGIDGTSNNGRVQNLNGYVLAMIDTRNWGTAPLGSNWSAVAGNIYHHNTWIAQNLGEVFGVTLDGNNNIYVTGTTVYGGNYAWGPNGSAGIYRINANTGAITNLTATGPYAAGTAFIPNDGAGLGNICYSPTHNLLYVTNFFDGMIYRVDPSTGNVLSRFDPLTPAGPPSGSPAFAPLGDRPWGIGYNKHENRLYFGLWKEYSSTPSNGQFNEIYSIGLDGTGDFAGVEVLEKKVTEYTGTNDVGSPISDITFSSDGLKMLIGQRTMNGSIIPSTTLFWAHASKVIEYERVAGLWVPTAGHISPYQNGSQLKFKVGAPGGGTNSAGGVAYGYESFSSELPQSCDQSVWCTGDALSTTHGSGAQPWIYGLQGLPATGGSNYTSALIDFNNNTSAWDKTQIGDVEVFKCISCIETPPCDSLSVSLTPVPFIPGQTKDCCYNIDLSNAVPATFASVNISVSGASLNVLDVHPNTGASWGLESFVDGISAELGHSSGYIPTGTFSCGSICLSNISAAEQSVSLQFLDAQGESLCDTVIKVKCDFCATVSQDSIRCTSGGLQQLSFCVQAADNLGHSIQSVVLTPPPGVTFTPKAFAISPPLAPGDPCRTITTTVDLGSSGVAGELCYTVTVHEADITKGIPPLRCCMIDHCTTLPDCLCDSTLTYATFERAVPLAEGLCCYNIILHQPDGAFVAVETEVVSTGSTLSGVGSDPDWDGTFITPKDVWWTPDPSSTLPAVTTLPTLCFGGEAPQVLEITWMTADSTICQDYLQFNCTDYDCAVFDSVSMTCNVFGGSAVTFQFTVTNLSGLDANHVALVNISPTGVITGQTIFPVSLPDGVTSPTLMTTLNNSVGTEACLQVNLYHMNPNDSLDVRDCCLTDTLCFTMPHCIFPNTIQPILVFPNPARDEVTVYFSEGASTDSYLRVLDLTGRILREEAVPTQVNAYKTSIRDYPVGLYFIEIMEGEHRIWSSKVVRQGWD